MVKSSKSQKTEYGMLTISPGWHAKCLRVCLYGQLLLCTGSAITVILDHSLLYLIIGLAGNQTECLLDSSATHNFISSQWCSDQGTKVVSDS